MEQRRLRILYTINNAPSYTLAFSRTQVAISLLPSFASSSQKSVETLPVYGSVDLRTCLDSICASSPEFFLDATQDYSVYVLDPLESPPTNNPDEPSLIPMGLGFLSVIRSPEESRTITGTFMALKTGERVLEVYFSLKPVTRELPSNSSNSKNRSMSRSASRNQTSGHASGSRRGYNHSRNSVGPEIASTAAERILSQTYRSGRIITDLPSKTELFAHCPPLEPQPKTPTSSISLPPSQCQPQASTSFTTSLPPSQTTLSQPQASTTSIPLPPSQTTTQLSNSLNNNLAGLLNPADPNAMTLLALLGMIDSGELPSASNNPTLATALQQLWAQVDSSQVATQQPGPSNSHQRQPSQDEEVVFLDKENVNPTAFRRRAEREREEAKLLGSSSSVRPEVSPPRVGLSVRSNTMNDLPVPSAPRNSESTAGRKRTLSDADSSRRERQRRVPSGRIDPTPSLALDPYRHYDRIAEAAPAGSSLVTQSSPPRPSRDENTRSGNSRGRPIVIPDSPLRVPASSPVRRPQKKYVVPEWARTNTATQPRLSDAVQQSIKDAQHRKGLEREAKRARLHRSSSSQLSQPTTSQSSTPPPSSQDSMLPPSSSQSSTVPSSSQGSSSNTSIPSLLPPVAAGEDFLSAALTTSPPSPPRSPPSRNTSLPFLPRTPKTPSRRPRLADDSPDGVDGSLFTPLAKTPIRNPHTPFGPPINSPCRHPSKSSPFLRGASLLRAKGVSDTDTDRGDEASSTLPMASSDVEDEDEPEDHPEQTSSRRDEGAASPVVKQYWQGLPPSSPPSSPAFVSSDLLPTNQPEEDQTEDAQLPVISSDVEEDFTADTGTPGSDSARQTPLDGNETETSELDVFNLFMNSFSSDDENLFMDGMNMEEGTGEESLDLNEIFKGVMPWLGGPESTSNHDNPDACNLDLDFDQLPAQDFDGTKPAQEMQALFSGCVL
ncbi:hypothetical protein D9758_008453 [Tetrapyrgos nigripes]|uniref:Ams2/SPT21 N-terminal domain-containing protein n=1 Tax=Tetrapyrgos nigripes TaxID=182062 RepID=A0A8H5CQN3_9AGAR|nr:hypothetical protein D9758_008453 [Tetrapyrgos nigripes]